MSGESQDFTLIKRGEIVVDINLQRAKGGIAVSAKVHPVVEDFLRSWGDGSAQDVNLHGRSWFPLKPGGAPLMVWKLSQDPGSQPLDRATTYRIARAGHPLIESIEVANDTVNLSFLRLCGISEGSGVSFGVKGVFTEVAIRELGDKLVNAAKVFYVSYMRPIDLRVRISTEEVKQ